MKHKRAWTRGEKFVLIVPTLLLAAVALFSWRLARGPQTIVLPDGKEELEPRNSVVRSLNFSPDSQRLAVVYQATAADFSNAIFDVAKGQKTGELQFPGQFPDLRLTWSSDGRRLAGTYNSGSVKIKRPNGGGFDTKPRHDLAAWDAQTGGLLWKVPYARAPRGSSVLWVDFSRDDSKIAGSGRPAAFFDAATGARGRTFPLPAPTIQGSSIATKLCWRWLATRLSKCAMWPVEGRSGVGRGVMPHESSGRKMMCCALWIGAA